MTPTEKDAMALAVLDAAAVDTEHTLGCPNLAGRLREARAHLASRITEDADEIYRLNVRLIEETNRTDRAEAELAAVREDRARLDWLESNKADVFQTMHSNEFAVQVCDDLHAKAEGYAPTLRAAIDAARGGE